MKYRIFKENKLVIASHNQGKIKEIRELLQPLNIEILSAYDLKIEEPEENGCTFEENALIKSSFVSKATSYLVCLMIVEYVFLILIMSLAFTLQGGLGKIKTLI